jgi:hypothetical protein
MGKNKLKENFTEPQLRDHRLVLRILNLKMFRNRNQRSVIAYL